MTAQSDAAPSSPAESYEQDLVPALFLPWAADLIRRTAPRSGERVLDVACGTGAVARQVASLVGPDGTVTGLDVSPAMLAVARGLPVGDGVRIDWQAGSAQSLPFADGSFDVVLCQQGVQFFPDRDQAIREMRRVLVAGGRIGISASAGLDQQPVYAAINRTMERHTGVPALAQPFSLGRAADLEALLIGAGFRDVVAGTMTRPVHFASAARFVRASVLGSAAAVTALAALEPAARAALVTAVEVDSVGLLGEYITADGLTFPVATNVATARA